MPFTRNLQNLISIDSSRKMVHFLGFIVVTCPVITLAILGLMGLFGKPLDEASVDRLTKINVLLGLSASLTILGVMLWTGSRFESIEFGNFVNLNQEHFHFNIKFVFDRLSIPMTVMSFVLVGVIGSFANVYLHRDAGYQRFFIFYSMFLVGLLFAFLAGTIETLFLGWELVGLSSALLIAYFHERPAPVQNGQRVWAIYRIADASFLMAAIVMHHLSYEGEFTKITGSAAWPDGASSLEGYSALLVGGLLLFAAAGKSGLIPFSGWLPRAMEGPTPSSAVFYGALSIHLGAYLLMRISPLMDASPLLRCMVITLGVSTALFAAFTSRVQTDVKSSLAYASVCQVGIIVAEIGCGFLYVALIHMIGHACLRSLQLLRAPTLMRDYKTLENAIGGNLSHGSLRFFGWFPQRWESRMYRFALERGYMDSVINEYVVRPFRSLFLFLDRLEQRWLRFLSGEAPKENESNTNGAA